MRIYIRKQTLLKFSAFLMIISLLNLSLGAYMPSVVEAQGSSDRYVFFYNKNENSINNIKAALRGGDRDGLRQTSVYGKGGALGSKPFAFTYDSLATGFSGGSRTITYAADYDCKNPEGEVFSTFSLYVEITLPQNFDEVQNYQGKVRSTEAKSKNGGNVEPCAFQGALGGRNIRVANYHQLLPSAKSAWPGLQTSIERGGQRETGNSFYNQGGQEPEDNLGCSSELSFGWAICAVVEAVGQFTDYVFSNIIQPMMENSPLSSESSDPFYKSWQSFRFIGNILLIGSMLAIVYSMARGDE